MAEVIARLKVESKEYEAKINRAKEGLLQLERTVRNAGESFLQTWKDEQAFAKGLGQMQTVSKSAAGQLSELKGAFVDLSMVYKRMTDEEKKSPFGKALSSSLSELKTRIDEAKGNLADVTTELNGGGGGGLKGALDAVASKFGLNIQQLAGWGAAIGAAKVALDVAKDAFFASEATVDEWGRTMDANKSLYEGFLTAINTGDISGYLSRIDDIVSAARTAYNELDRLGTMKTIQAPQMSAQQTENDRIRQMIQTGRYIAPLDGRKPAPGMKDGQLLTPEQIRRLEQQLQNGMKTVVGLIGNEVKQTGKAIDAVYERQAQELGMSLDEFRKGTSSMAEFDKRMQDYQKYRDYENEHSTLIRTSYGTRTIRDDTENPYEGAQKWATFRVDGDRYNELVQLILQRDQQAAQAYGMQSQAYRAINRAEGITTRTILGGGSGGGSSTTTTTATAKELSPLQQAQKEISALTEEALTADEGRLEVIKKEIAALNEQVKLYKEIQDYVNGSNKISTVVGVKPDQIRQMEEELKKSFTGVNLSEMIRDLKSQIANSEIGSDFYNSLTSKIADATALQNLIKVAIEKGIDPNNFNANSLWEALLSAEGISDEQLQEVVDYINQFMGEHPIKLNVDTGSVSSDGKGNNKSEGNESVVSVSSKMASGISSISSSIERLGVKLPEGLNAVITGIQTISSILSGISAIVSAIEVMTTVSSLPFFARGGIAHAANGLFVPGNSYSGDNVPALLNSGELILNKAAQGNLASQLQEGNGGKVSSTPYVSGEQIYLGLTNYLIRSGRGELLTARG